MYVPNMPCVYSQSLMGLQVAASPNKTSCALAVFDISDIDWSTELAPILAKQEHLETNQRSYFLCEAQCKCLVQILRHLRFLRYLQLRGQETQHGAS